LRSLTLILLLTGLTMLCSFSPAAGEDEDPHASMRQKREMTAAEREAADSWHVRSPMTFFGSAYGNDIFVVVGEHGTIVTSLDGKTWALRKSAVKETLRAAAYGKDAFVVVGDKGAVLTSSDGTTWTRGSSGVAHSLYGIAFGKDSFVAAGENGTLLKSRDGITWEPVASGQQIALRNVVFPEPEIPLTISTFIVPYRLP